ncbi:MAG: PEGA domain-containing protein [Ignavibacteriales bacterium]|nr:PEGA domain-containing protein [Ignavibacteriales bacterium]
MQRIQNSASYLCLFAAIIIAASGCATIFHGSTDKLNFSSDPTGAKVYVNGQYMGTAPLELKLESKHSYTIEFRKEGYDNKTVVVTSSVGAGWIVLDVIFGLVPVIVDAATGNWYSLDQDHVNAALEKQQAK